MTEKGPPVATTLEGRPHREPCSHRHLEASDFKHADTEAIAVALEEYLADDSVAVLQIDGPAILNAAALDGLGPAIKYIGNLARSRGKRSDSSADLSTVGSQDLVPVALHRSFQQVDRQSKLEEVRREVTADA